MYLKQCLVTSNVEFFKGNVGDIIKSHKTIKQYAYILHDKDLGQSPHWTIYLNFGNSGVDTKQVGEWFGLQESQVERVKGRKTSVLEYLTHSNDTQQNKYQYSPSEVIANFDFQTEIKNAKILGDFENYSYARQLEYVNSLPVSEKASAFSQLEKLWKLQCRWLTLQTDRKLEVMFICGKGGTGKTYYAKKLLNSMGYDYCVSSSSNDPFQDYLGQKAIILDDLRDKSFEFEDLLKILDNNTVSSVQSRFQNKVFNGALIVITSSVPLRYWYRKIDRTTLWRWRKQYDGTVKSLEPKFSRKGIHHPNEQTEEEKQAIQNLVRRNPTIGLNELYGKLCRQYGYKRNPVTLYRYLRRNDFYKVKKRKPYIPKPYDTPLSLGEKWQLDVKHVPFECYTGNEDRERHYQYTVIDEASRKRFIYAYREQSQNSTVDFVLRAFEFFGYRPKIIQTDNGVEFCFLRGKGNQGTKDGRIHLLDKLCLHFGIKHQLIRPRTPRHNGKVERSHRNDNERFYRYLRYYSFSDLQTQMAAYLKRSNDIPTCVLRSHNSCRWLSPNEKEQELLANN